VFSNFLCVRILIWFTIRLIIFIYLFIFGSTRGWTQALVLATQVLHHLSLSASHFCVSLSVLRWDLVFAQAILDHNLPTLLPWAVWVTGACHPYWTGGWHVVLWNFCLWYLQTVILPISALQVSRITGVRLQAQPCFSFHLFSPYNSAIQSWTVILCLRILFRIFVSDRLPVLKFSQLLFVLNYFTLFHSVKIFFTGIEF
jgi:hypothetical protein